MGFAVDFYTDEELSPLLTPGEGRFKIKEALEKVSQAGNPMMVLNMDLIDCNGREGFHSEFLIKSEDDRTNRMTAAKIKAIANCIGKPDMYSEGAVLHSIDVLGEKGKCMIKTQISKDSQYPDKSIVAKYLPVQADAPVDNTPNDELGF